ncbi:hypothetical protein BDZ89DRAFT_1134626 [Hymenopellis radicata]|nr:hypothetical protein BDZ89DRAFT_1134626 [Hymenopellis radicata]
MAIDQTPPDIVQPSSADREKTSDVGDRPKYDDHQRGRGRGRGRGGRNNASRNWESSGPRKEWHEEWKDLEDYIHHDPGGYNPNTPCDDHQRGRGRGRGRGGMNNASRNWESSGPHKEWHEEWKDLEDYIHPGGYNPNTPVTDRVRSAAIDFARNRMWPREFDSPL